MLFDWYLSDVAILTLILMRFCFHCWDVAVSGSLLLKVILALEYLTSVAMVNFQLWEGVMGTLGNLAVMLVWGYLVGVAMVTGYLWGVAMLSVGYWVPGPALGLAILT